MITVNEPLIGESELQNVIECMRTGWISSSGRFIDEFEAQWASYCGRRFGVASSSGTTALQLALACLDLEPGDEVIMPTFTIISCALAVVGHGGLPVLVDSDPDTWCMNVDSIEQCITPRTRAIMVVHMYGHPVDMDPVLEIAERYGLVVIEDAAEAHGAEYLKDRAGTSARWQRCGGFGLISCFSFYANKLITTGEGGMLLTNEETVAARARSLRNLCFQTKRRFLHEELGQNYRLTNLQAAIGVAQIQRIDELIERKRRIASEYTERLRDVDALQLPVERAWARSIYWMYGVVLSEAVGLDAGCVAARLGAEGIETRPFFLGMHEQPVFRNRGLFANEQHPVAERLARQGLYLPSGLALVEEQVDRVCRTLREVLN